MRPLFLFLCLVPAPKDPPKPINPLVGAWCITWNAGVQTTFFYADGACDSPEFGAGKWEVDEAGSIWFSERNNTMHYVMIVDLATGLGNGWRVDADGVPGGWVPVLIRRGERLQAPREK